MNWEETLKFVRENPQYNDLIDQSFLSEDLVKNVKDYRSSDEYAEIKKIINELFPGAASILDIGAGNGISSMAFALDGFNVTALEPDPSDSIGAGAIRMLKEKMDLKNVTVLQGFAEDLALPANSFDIVFCRQAMHHASDLKSFLKESARVLKPNGGYMAVRDHVINSQKDKTVFLNKHPLHQFYGGENAFKLKEYVNAIESAGLEIVRILKYYESVINYYPAKREEIENLPAETEIYIRQKLKTKFGAFGRLSFIIWLYKLYSGNLEKYNDKKIPGRPYTFIAKKKGNK
jgi:ubiquinone/menaquinone biosynthesis C-methylase UbiE